MDPRDPGHPSLFVSYAHEDQDIVAELRKCFIPLERRFGCQLLWDDSRIRGGQLWLDQIEQAMAEARFAVLLMSADFMASSFIQNQELPMLVGPIDLSISGVDQLQFVNPPGQPLGGMGRFARQAWYRKVAMAVKEVLKQGRSAADDGQIGPAAAALAYSPDSR